MAESRPETAWKSNSIVVPGRPAPRFRSQNTASKCFKAIFGRRRVAFADLEDIQNFRNRKILKQEQAVADYKLVVLAMGEQLWQQHRSLWISISARLFNDAQACGEQHNEGRGGGVSLDDLALQHKPYSRAQSLQWALIRNDGIDNRIRRLRDSASKRVKQLLEFIGGLPLVAGLP